MRTETRKLTEVYPYPNNPRINDGAVDAVVESIKQCTYVAPIIVDEDYVILAGHTRHKALVKLGYGSVDVIVKDGLTEEQKQKYRLLDNKTNELADWDLEKLEQELDGIDFGGYDFGFDADLSQPIDVGKTDLDDTKYTDKTDVPQYTPSGDDVDLSECFDRTKADFLIQEIESSHVSDAEKEFLKLAAMRHLSFTYKRIADYYAKASKEMQELMEHSALVIIDFDDAIRNGYAELRGKVRHLQEVEHADD